MAKKGKMSSGAACPSCHSVCGRCKGIGLLVVGILVLANAVWSFVDWWLLVGALLVLKGLVMLVKPNGCGCR